MKIETIQIKLKSFSATYYSTLFPSLGVPATVSWKCVLGHARTCVHMPHTQILR